MYYILCTSCWFRTSFSTSCILCFLPSAVLRAVLNGTMASNDSDRSLIMARVTEDYPEQRKINNEFLPVPRPDTVQKMGSTGRKNAVGGGYV